MSAQAKIFGPEVRYSEHGTPTTEILYWTIVELEPGKKVRVNIRTDYLTRLELKEFVGDPDRVMRDVLQHYAEDLLKSGWRPSEGDEIRVGATDIEPLYRSWKTDSAERSLGDILRGALAQAGSGYELLALQRNSDAQIWNADIRTATGETRVSLPMGVVNEVLASGVTSEVARIRKLLWFGLGRTDLLFEGKE
ncbi:MAG TPA: hypothetical protein VFU76_01140 [Terriglobales bacterium]|nr:hypothetical protein [Terriglobales bacterium]